MYVALSNRLDDEDFGGLVRMMRETEIPVGIQKETGFSSSWYTLNIGRHEKKLLRVPIVIPGMRRDTMEVYGDSDHYYSPWI